LHRKERNCELKWLGYWPVASDWMDSSEFFYSIKTLEGSDCFDNDDDDDCFLFVFRERERFGNWKKKRKSYKQTFFFLGGGGVGWGGFSDQEQQTGSQRCCVKIKSPHHLYDIWYNWKG
jgi:hypothetical protein